MGFTEEREEQPLTPSQLEEKRHLLIKQIITDFINQFSDVNHDTKIWLSNQLQDDTLKELQRTADKEPVKKADYLAGMYNKYCLIVEQKITTGLPALMFPSTYSIPIVIIYLSRCRTPTDKLGDIYSINLYICINSCIYYFTYKHSSISLPGLMFAITGPNNQNQSAACVLLSVVLLQTYCGSERRCL